MQRRHFRTIERPRCAYALIVAVGLLAILAVLATTFATLSGIEHQTAANYVCDAKAMMLAHSGIEYATARLHTPGLAGSASAYGGEDWNGDGSGIGTADGYADDWNGNRNGMVDVSTCDLRYARRPSFFADEDRDGLPDLISIQEAGVVTQRGYSGRLPGTFHKDGDTFVVKVEDTSSRVSINQKGAGYRHLYDNLGQLVLGTPNIGARIQAGQPYGLVDDLVGAGVFTTAELDLMRPYLTVYAWEDPTVIRPDPQTDSFLRPENLRRLDYLEPRAPINVNTADFLVLEACFLGLTGFNTDRIVPRKKTFVLSSKMAQQLAQAIVLARAETFTDANANGQYDAGELFVDQNGNGRYDGPFRAWQQFEDFVSGVKGFVGNGHGRGANNFSWPKDLVCANANPNTMLNCLQPDHMMRRSIDKSDLTSYTTEFCFESNGTYSIRSYGRITDVQGNVIAEKEIEVVGRLFETVKLTTQEDFESAQVKLASGPDVMTIPEDAAGITTESYTDVNYDGRFDKGDTFTDATGDGMRDGPAIYDGQITLRPADPPTIQPWGDAASTIAFRCLFNDSPKVYALGPDVYPSLTADIASPTAVQGVPLSAGALRTTVRAGGSLLQDLDGANDYPDLGPNGLYVREETGQTIYWNSILNWPVGSGSISFWLRPVWESHPAANQYKDMLALNQQFSLDPNRGRLTQLYSVHFGTNPGLFVLESHLYTRSKGTAATEVADDTGYDPPGLSHTTYKLNLDWDWTPDQWHHVALAYTDQIRWRCYLDGEPFRDLLEQDSPRNGGSILANPTPTYNHMTLGSHMPWFDTIGSGIYDDFVIYRSQVPASDLGLTPAWRFDDTNVPGYSTYLGRVTLPAGGIVRSIAWTEWRPDENYRFENLSSKAALPRMRRPDVHFSYRMGGEPAFHDAPRPSLPDDYDGGTFNPIPNLPPNGVLEFQFAFDRNGQDPFRNSAYVDDLTVTYTRSGGLSILSWRIVQ